MGMGPQGAMHNQMGGGAMYGGGHPSMGMGQMGGGMGAMHGGMGGGYHHKKNLV